MSTGLSAEDKAALAAELFAAPILMGWKYAWRESLMRALAPAVEQIVARHLAAFKAEAVAAIEGRYAAATSTKPHDPLPMNLISAERCGWLSGLQDAARWVRNLDTT